MLAFPGALVRGITTATFLILTCLTLSLQSCGSDSEQNGSDAVDSTQSSETAGNAKFGGIFRMNETDGIRTLDPVALSDAPSHHVVHQIAELLVDFDGDLQLQPELAESWEMSEDLKTYTYHLRKGVRFHDNACFADGKGREMTAQDVKFCFDRILDARSGTKGADYFRDRVVGGAAYFKATAAGNKPDGGVAGFKVIDDYTFAIELIEPFAEFKYYPTLGVTYIYPHEAVEKYGKDFFRNLVGTGPFVLKEWKQDQELTMTRNPNYWRKDGAGNQLPYLDGVRISFAPDQATMLTDFQNGNLEENYRIPVEFVPVMFEPRPPGSDAEWKLTGEWSKFQLFQSIELSSQYYGMLTTSEVFSDPKVRQAFNYAIDRNRIIEFVMKGQAGGPAIHGIVPPSMPNYPVDRIKGYVFNASKAKQLLADAGFPNGQGFPKVTLQYNQGGGRNTTIAEAIQAQLKQNLGISIGLQATEWGQHIESIDNGRADFYRLGWIADYPDPENFLNLLYGGNARPKGEPSPLNSTRYNNPQFDSLFQQALMTADDAARMDLFAQAEQIAVNDAPMLWIIYDMQFRLVQPWVRNYHSNAMDRRDLTAVWFENGPDNGSSSSSAEVH